jgi:hypothetical protein
MNHLTDSEFVDLIDQSLPPARIRHIEECVDCRAQAESLRETLLQAADAPVPEPSPLFWDHFAARVRETVDSSSPTASNSFGWLHHHGLRWGIAGSVLVLIVIAGVWRVTTSRTAGDDSRQMATTETAAAADGTQAGLDGDDVEGDEAWALVRTIADDVSWDDATAEGLGVRPGVAERAAMELTVEERSELVRLLDAEMQREKG